MAVVWGISTGIWILVASVAFAGCIVIARMLALSFAALRELKDSLELSGRMVNSALETAREEAERASAALARLGRSRESGSAEPEQPWSDW